MIEDSDAEFVCLQEVTHAFMHRYLLPSEFIRKTYFVSGNTLPNYGVLILSKVPCNFFEVPLPSGMGRSMLVCETSNGFAVATVHLESGQSNGEARKTQLRTCLKILQGSFESSLLMGDCNFSTQHVDHQQIISDEGFNDCYLDLLKGEEEWTMPPKKGFETGWRPDRVLGRLKDWRPIEV